MKPYLQLLTNWRIVALAALAIVAILLILGECEKISTLLIVKAAGFAIAYGCYRLSQHWDKKGLINELNIFDAQ
jgi:hypothetical protein